MSNKIPSILWWSKLTKQSGEANKTRIEKGLSNVQPYGLPRTGQKRNFETFVLNILQATLLKLENLFKRFAANGNRCTVISNMISLDLKRGMHVDIGEMLQHWRAFLRAYEPGAISTRIFSITSLHLFAALNFPFLPLRKKRNRGRNGTVQSGHMFVWEIYSPHAYLRMSMWKSPKRSPPPIIIYQVITYMLGTCWMNREKRIFAKDMKTIISLESTRRAEKPIIIIQLKDC